MAKNKVAIFNINGGIGKTIAATAVCKAIKKKYPEHNLYVISGYPEVFLNNPSVHRAYGFGQASYFYSDVVENNEVVLFAHDPYMDTLFVPQDKHLIQIWCEMFDIPYEGEKPELFLTDREIKFNQSKFTSDRPIFLLQTNGGGGGENAPKYSWARDIPASVVVKVIEEFGDTFNMVHIRRPDQIAFEKTFSVSDNFRSIAVLISMSNTRLLMDSFAQHAAAAFGLQSTVLWIANSPTVFGYDIHNNIQSNPHTTKPELKDSYLTKFDIGGNALQFPYNNEDEIFDADKIIAAVKESLTIQ